MKKIFFFFAYIFFAFCLVSCSNEDELTTNEDGMVVKKFKALHAMPSLPGTRTELKADGKTVVWQTGEQMGVFDNGTLKPAYTLETGAGEAAGTFVGYANSESKAFYAVSPYRSDITIAGSTISGLKVKAHQTPKKGTYDPEAAVMTSYTTNNTMAFFHVCSFVKVVVDDCDEMKHLMRISIETKNAAKTGPGRDLAGTFDATIKTTGADAGLATISNIHDGSAKITMDAPVGEVIKPGTYYFAILPGDIEHLEVRFETVKKSFMRRLNPNSADHKKFNRAEIRNLGKFPDTWTWTEDKRQEVIYSGNYITSVEGGEKHIFFAAGNLQAVMGGANTIKSWKIADNQYDYIGIGSSSAPTGNYKVSSIGEAGYEFADNDVIDMFAWVANGFTTDALEKYGIINKKNVIDGTATSNYLNNNRSENYNLADSGPDWGGAYTSNSGTKRTWKMLNAHEWDYLFCNSTVSHSATFCTVTKEDGVNTVNGIWVYPAGTLGKAAIPNTCSYEDYLEYIAKGHMFFPSYNYLARQGKTAPTGSSARNAYYWSSDAKEALSSVTGVGKMFWTPNCFSYVTGSGCSVKQDRSVDQRCFVRLYTEATITAE